MLAREIRHVNIENFSFYGIRTMPAMLERRGYVVVRDQAARTMHIRGVGDATTAHRTFTARKDALLTQLVDLAQQRFTDAGTERV